MALRGLTQAKVHKEPQEHRVPKVPLVHRELLVHKEPLVHRVHKVRLVHRELSVHKVHRVQRHYGTLLALTMAEYRMQLATSQLTKDRPGTASTLMAATWEILLQKEHSGRYLLHKAFKEL